MKRKDKVLNLNAEVLDIDEAAAYLKMNFETLRLKANLGEIPGSKPGRKWVFLKEDLNAYLRGCYGKKAVTDKITGRKIWVSTNQANIGELELPRQTEDAYNAALKRKTVSKRNVCTTR